MRNVLSILWRDLKRMARVPVALVIAVGLMVLPATYAWVNVLGFWDPYGNTGNVRVSVANEDQGADSPLTGHLGLGAQIVDTLKKNTELGWSFTDKAGAMTDVESGKSYAAIVIPKDFSASISALIDGGGERPELKYYVNEKTSPIAPKVTDTAASTLDRQINDTFVSTVSQVAVEMINQAGGELENAETTLKTKVSDTLATVSGDLSDARATLAKVRASLKDTPDSTKSMREGLEGVRTLSSQASQSLTDAGDLAGAVGEAINGFATDANEALTRSNQDLSSIGTLAQGMVGQVTGGVQAAGGKVDATLDSLTSLNDSIGELIDTLDQHLGDVPLLKDQIDKAQASNQTLSGLLDDLTTVSGDLAGVVDSADQLSGQVNTALQSSLTGLAGAQNTLMTTSLPSLNASISQLSASASTLSLGLAGQSALIDQAGGVADQLDQTSAAALNTIDATDKALASIETRIDTLATDLDALSVSTVVGDLLGQGTDGGFDVASIADFMLSPTVLDTHTVYPVNSYGSGMAPLFTSLALWAGAFMLVVIFRLETDDEGIVGMTPTQGYLGRWAFLAIIAALQGLVVTIGDLIIGVQTVNPAAFIATGVITGMVDIAIAYALSTTFLHVGKALCVILIVIQIPGASGLYPIEMMPSFFRTLYPFFPFSHSITAFRETIGGFYGTVWAREIGVLLVFAALAFLLGLVVRPRLANVNRLFAREIAASDLLIGETVRIEGRRYPLGQVLRALSDREEYRRAIEWRAARFAVLYPRLKRAALIIGFVVPAVLTITFSLTVDTKLVALGTWGVWALIIIGFLMTLEYARDRLRRQVELGNLDDEAIRRAAVKQMRRRSRGRRENRRENRRGREGRHTA